MKIRIRRTLLTRAAAFRTKRLIVFFTPGYDLRAGGILSIASIYRESIALRNVHHAKVVLSAVPGDDPLFLKYTWFKNSNYLLDLEAVLAGCPRLEYLLLHIPEYAVNRAVDWLTATPRLLGNVKELHINVLVQNIDLAQGQNFQALKDFGKVTCTTGHESYTNAATRDLLGIALHRLSVCNGPERYKLTGYMKKEPLLIVSPDEHVLREKVLGQIAQALPDLRIQVIQDLHYEDYLKLISRTKWSLSFGEGFDGYFHEPLYCGAVPFGVFNERYFTPPFAALETVYPSWEVLMEKMAADLQRLDEPVAYNRCWRQAYDLLCGLYSTEGFRQNLRLFYRGEYTFP